MRVLILSANTGGGHNSTARALADQLERNGAEYEIADTLALISETVSEFISWGHSYVYRKLPHLFGIGYRFEEKHTPRFMYEQCSKGAEALYHKLNEGSFDAVLCVHVFSGLMVTEMRERFHLMVPAYFVATDYTASPGVSEMKLDGYFIPHRMLFGEFVRSDVRADKMFATGIPIGEAFYKRIEQTEARRSLGLPEDRRIVLLSCGSMGCGNLDKNALTVAQHLPNDAMLIVLCGKNEKSYEVLSPLASEKMQVIGFTDQVATYMSAADLYITKPGGLTTSESIAKHLPMILIDAVPGLETRNYDFLIGNGVASGARNWRQASALVQKFLKNPALAEKQIEAMKRFTTHNAAETICKHILQTS